MEKGREAAMRISKEKENVECEFLYMDLNSLETVLMAAYKLKMEYRWMDRFVYRIAAHRMFNLVFFFQKT